jgi:hypothetical protein
MNGPIAVLGFRDLVEASVKGDLMRVELLAMYEAKDPLTLRVLLEWAPRRLFRTSLLTRIFFQESDRRPNATRYRSMILEAHPGDTLEWREPILSRDLIAFLPDSGHVPCKELSVFSLVTLEKAHHLLRTRRQDVPEIDVE